MTKYDDQAEQRCPRCGTPVRLTDVNCPRCEQVLYYGHNLQADKRLSKHPLATGFPGWLKISLIAANILLFIIAFITRSDLLLILTFLLFILLWCTPIMLLGGLCGFKNVRFDKCEPWDRSLYDPDAERAK